MNNYKNPFNTGSPADPNNFYGRTKIISEINNFLVNPNQNTFLINGQRRIGKTSLLRKIQKELALTGYKPVYFDLQNKGELSLPEILFELMQIINLELEINNDLSPENFTDNYSIFEEKYIKKIVSKHKNIVLLFDEFDVLGDRKFIAEDEKTKHLAYVKFVPYLQEIIEKKYELNFIFAIGRTLNDLAEYYGPIKKFSQVQEITYFEFQESNQLIGSLTKESISFKKETIEKIHEITFGHPYYLQCLCSYLFDKAVEKKIDEIRPNDVDKHLKSAIKKYSGGLSWFWDGFKPEEKIYLFIIAQLQENNQPTDDNSISQKFSELQIRTLSPKFIGVLSKLMQFQILKKENVKNSYKITVPFVQKWIAYEHNIESIYQEVDKVDKLLKMYLDLGKLHMENEEYSEAIENFKKVLKRNPDNFEAQYNLACALNYGNLAKEEDIIDEFEKAYSMDSVQTKETYLSLLKRFSEKTNKLEYFDKLLKIDSSDRITQQKYLDLYFAKWKDDFNNKRYSAFLNTIKTNKWILANYKNLIENFFDDLFEYYVNNNKLELIIECLNNVSESISSIRFNKWIIKTYGSFRKEIYRNAKWEGIIEGKEEGYKTGKEEGYKTGKEEGYKTGKEEGYKEGIAALKKAKEELENEISRVRWKLEEEGYKKGLGRRSLFFKLSIAFYILSLLFFFHSITNWNVFELNTGIRIQAIAKELDFSFKNLIMHGLYHIYHGTGLKIIFWILFLVGSVIFAGVPIKYNSDDEKRLGLLYSILFLGIYPLYSFSIFGINSILLGFNQLFSSFTIMFILSLIAFSCIFGALLYSIFD